MINRQRIARHLIFRRGWTSYTSTGRDIRYPYSISTFSSSCTLTKRQQEAQCFKNHRWSKNLPHISTRAKRTSGSQEWFHWIKKSKNNQKIAAVAAAVSCVLLGGFEAISKTLAQQENETEQAAATQNFLDNTDNAKGESNGMDPTENNQDDDEDDTTTMLNWSGTHSVDIPGKFLFEPESIQELERLVKDCHERGQPIRPVGSSLSPNALALNATGMVSMANLDQIVDIDTKQMTVTVQAGARVSQVIDALRPHGLTLPNLASIAEQQMGGFTQVGAHGTGATIGPLDAYVTELKLVTPAKQTLVLNGKNDDLLFQLAKVGLGCLGIVSELTIQCVPAHNLVEHTFTMTRAEATQRLNELLRRHKHVRYMWIPYTDAVVCVTNDDEKDVPPDVPRHYLSTSSERFVPFQTLLKELKSNSEETKEQQQEGMSLQDLENLGFGAVRDAVLMAGDPLNVNHVKRCNQAEAVFWRQSEGYQTKPSDELLQFDCGGQQWVWEVCFPTGSLEQNTGNDMKFMHQLLEEIERSGIPAPAPIEQRWSASSPSLMSPAHDVVNSLHCWVGIIMYLPPDTDEHEERRKNITREFTGRYCDLLRKMSQKYEMKSHWAKLEIPPDASVWNLVDLQLELQERYPALVWFNKARRMLDPKNILSNPLLDAALGGRRSQAEGENGTRR